MRIALVFAFLSAAGCYRSHERGEAEAGLPTGDAGVVHPIDDHCPEGYLRVKDTFIFSENGRHVAYGGMQVVGRSGVLLADPFVTPPYMIRDHYDICFPRSEAPLSLELRQEGGTFVIVDVDDDFVGETWARWPRTGGLGNVRGRLMPQQPGSVFEVNFGPDLNRSIRETPFQTEFNSPIGGVWRARFLELSAEGELLGGGEAPYAEGLVLDAHGSVLARTTFEVELPESGMLAGLPLEVRALDCSGNTGAARPGQLDDWRCSFSGVGRVESQDGRVARGTLEYLEGPVLHTGFVTAHLGSEEAGLEAYVFLPCCAEPLRRLAFPEVNTLEGSGDTLRNFHYRVDAPGYEHAFVFHWMFGPTFMYDFQADGATSTMPFFPSEMVEFPGVRAELDEPITTELWLGAITTVGRDPWAEGVPVAMVRRRIIP